MSTVNEIVHAAMGLGRSERTAIAMMMLDSLPDDTEEPEDILAEALRRDAEMEAGLVKPLSYDELLAKIQRPGRAA
ncbi:MAG: hypothetical protein J0L73_08265 [Verrucomicrobia bacterium]|nr:hypothetical protein [Verrucomicrobiota bacterium]